ncbi:hypothetical protein [Candidatus Aquicultor sp.]
MKLAVTVLKGCQIQDSSQCWVRGVELTAGTLSNKITQYVE